MRTVLVAALAALATVALAGAAAGAAELDTTRLPRLGGQGLRCSATNVGKKPIALVHMALVIGDGTEVDPNDCEDLGPSATCEVGDNALAGGAYCRVVFKGSAKQIRAMLAVVDAATGEVAAIEPGR